MRRFLSMLVAGAMAVGSTAVSFTPAQAAMVRPVPAATIDSSGGIEQVRHRRNRNYNNYSDWQPRHQWRRNHSRRHGGFYFNFPFPRHYAYRHAPRCRDLVMGHDGRWHCYRW